MGKKKPQVFILDVDGVMTTGHFLYTVEGKVMKIFGPDDNDGLSLLKIILRFDSLLVTKKGFLYPTKELSMT